MVRMDAGQGRKWQPLGLSHRPCLMLIPLKSTQATGGIPFGSCALMLANLAVYGLVAKGWLLPADSLHTYALTPEHCDFQRILVGLFLHNNVFQVLLSAWCLFLFGFPLEGWIKTPKFLLVYFASGLVGSFVKVLMLGAYPEAGQLLGSSAAIMGVIGACIYALPYTRIEVWYWFGLMRTRGWGFSDSSGYTWSMYGRHDPLNDSGEWSWPLWAVGFYVAVPDFAIAAIVASPAAYMSVLAGFPVGLLLPLILRQRREDAATVDALETYGETKDLGLLSSEELAAMWKSSPDDTTIILNWMYKSLHGQGGVSQTCMEAFKRRLPAILEQQPPESVAGVLAALNSGKDLIDSKYQIFVGSLLEKKQENRLAVETYEAVRRDGDADPDDVEAALFRLGVVYEKALSNPYEAGKYYKELIDRFPMGVFAEQARARLAASGRQP